MVIQNTYYYDFIPNSAQARTSCNVLLLPLQVRSIIGQVRPDRQTLLFSATMPNKVERLVQDALTSPVRVTVGEIGAANDDIKQACPDPSLVAPSSQDHFHCQPYCAYVCSSTMQRCQLSAQKFHEGTLPCYTSVDMCITALALGAGGGGVGAERKVGLAAVATVKVH